MNIELKHNKKEHPNKDGFYFAVNPKGYIGLVKFENNEWIAYPFIDKSILFQDEGFYWFNIPSQPERLSEETSKEDATV